MAQKAVESSEYKNDFKRFIPIHDTKGNNSDYKLSFFTNWENSRKDICFARFRYRIEEWERAGKGSFFYFDNYMDYIDYDKLSDDINELYKRYLSCVSYTNEEKTYILFEFKEKQDISGYLAMCMYSSIFTVFRATGNEFERVLKGKCNKILDKEYIETLLDSIILHCTIIPDAYGHSLNDGISFLTEQAGISIVPLLAKYYIKVVKNLFSEDSPLDKKELDEFVTKRFIQKWEMLSFPGQTKLFGVLEDSYHGLIVNK